MNIFPFICILMVCDYASFIVYQVLWLWQAFSAVLFAYLWTMLWWTPLAHISAWLVELSNPRRERQSKNLLFWFNFPWFIFKLRPWVALPGMLNGFRFFWEFAKCVPNWRLWLQWGLLQDRPSLDAQEYSLLQYSSPPHDSNWTMMWEKTELIVSFLLIIPQTLD